MPLNGDAWGTAAAAAAAGAAAGIEAGTPVTPTQLETFWKAIKGVDTTQITTTAQVNAGIPVATTGSASAQSGATTGPGTIT